jgi:hypothetical protein
MPRDLKQVYRPGFQPELVSIRQIGKHASLLFREIERMGGRRW